VNSELKDSLCNQVSLQLENQLSNKDSLLKVAQDQIRENEIAIKESLEVFDSVVKENRTLAKGLKHQKRKGRLVSRIATVLTGALATIVLLNP
jgi:hypothetical protein